MKCDNVKLWDMTPEQIIVFESNAGKRKCLFTSNSFPQLDKMDFIFDRNNRIVKAIEKDYTKKQFREWQSKYRHIIEVKL